MKIGADRVRLNLSLGNSIATNQPNQFEEGQIEFLRANNTSLGVFEVLGNTTGATPTIRIIDPGPTGSLPDGIAKFRNLIDDDIHNSSTFKVAQSSDMAIVKNGWASFLEQSLIVPDFDTAEVRNESGTIPFDVNLDSSAELLAIIATHRGSRSEPGFWVGYHIGAFQGRVGKDLDPSTENPATLGITMRRDATTKGGSFVFAETIRDFAESPTAVPPSGVLGCRVSIAVHELGHLFQLDDDADDGPMYAPNQNHCDYTSSPASAWSGAARRKTMLTVQP